MPAHPRTLKDALTRSDHPNIPAPIDAECQCLETPMQACRYFGFAKYPSLPGSGNVRLNIEPLKVGTDLEAHLYLGHYAKDCLWIVDGQFLSRSGVITNDPFASFDRPLNDFHREFFGTSIYERPKYSNGELTFRMRKVDEAAQYRKSSQELLVDLRKHGVVIAGVGDRLELWPANRWKLAFKNSKGIHTDFSTLRTSTNGDGDAFIPVGGGELSDPRDIVGVQNFIAQLPTYKSDGPALYRFLNRQIQSKRTKHYIIAEPIEAPTVATLPDHYKTIAHLVPKNSGIFDGLTFPMKTKRGDTAFAVIPSQDGNGDFNGRVFRNGTHLLDNYFGTSVHRVVASREGDAIIFYHPDATPPLPGLLEDLDEQLKYYSVASSK